MPVSKELLAVLERKPSNFVEIIPGLKVSFKPPTLKSKVAVRSEVDRSFPSEPVKLKDGVDTVERSYTPHQIGMYNYFMTPYILHGYEYEVSGGRDGAPTEKPNKGEFESPEAARQWLENLEGAVGERVLSAATEFFINYSIATKALLEGDPQKKPETST